MPPESRTSFLGKTSEHVADDPQQPPNTRFMLIMGSRDRTALSFSKKEGHLEDVSSERLWAGDTNFFI